MGRDKKDSGWVRAYRSIQEHWLWEDKPFAYGQAWMDLILLAGYEEKTFMLQSPKKSVTLPRGALLTSEHKLSERWGWSRKKVHKFLENLEENEMLGIQRDGKGTILILRNYGLYQDFLEGEEPEKNRRSTGQEPERNRTGTGEEPERHTNNTVNKLISEEVNNTPTPETASFPSPSLPSWAADLAVRPVVVSDLDDLVLAGASPELIRWAASKAAGKGKGWAYARGIVRNSLSRGMRTPPPGNPQPSSRPSYDPEEFDRRGFDLPPLPERTETELKPQSDMERYGWDDEGFYLPPLPGMEEDTDEHFGN